MAGYLLSWTSGHNPPRRLYLRERAGVWCCSEDRGQATVYRTRDQAHSAWLDKHRFPEEYLHCIASGKVRAEAVGQPRLPFYGEER